MRKNILFVCTGNTCRSPMAEGIFNELASDRGLAVRAESCGLSAYPAPAAANAVEAAKAYGADIYGHIARSASRELMERADRVYAMTGGHADMLKAHYPEHADKVFTLPGGDISDPFGGSPERYRQCAAEIYSAASALLDDMEG